jgi:hypothetical protein
VVAPVRHEREQPSAAELGVELDAVSAAELRAELALLRRTMELILLVALVLVTIGLFAVLLVIGDGERVLARGVVVVMAGFAFSGTVLALRTLDVMPRLRRRSR